MCIRTVRSMMGGSRSRNRRTLSKNMYPGEPEHIVTKVSDRFFEIARKTTGYELHLDGQEPINWLYYMPGFEYRPHCDGGCGQVKIPYGDRVATTLVYCTTASKGGGTVFPNDGLKLEPNPGMMLLFTYNPDPQRLSWHSACPVLKGSKSTATQWYREGVSAELNWEDVTKGRHPQRRLEM
eukprot:gnl/MRDRNA2_/MRDRNA2_67268_c0_seq2.p1 gnl/MRDRNA2_/MRDRNA2_67268_c0~~gnl/MRDRNA2_/MRDRNA2_67268_c0_seq2.p1  ORF type:complete len:181 (+),score=13.53 gnl/MRDRNA2_/MRDRNA2_67268_c0_seq2:32-574(+)